MFRKLLAIAAAVMAAVLGLLAGRMVAQWRAQSAAGASLHIEPPSRRVRARDLMPGLMAALRTRDRPWSYLHVPPWLAAFAVNFAFAALQGEMKPFMRSLGLRVEPDDDFERPTTGAPAEVWTREAPPAPPERAATVAEGFRPFAP
jgi:hypothetical protein